MASRSNSTRRIPTSSCGWQGSTFSMFAHYGTHVDAPIHFIRDAATIEAAPLGKLIGPAGLIDLSDHCKAVGIAADTLEDRGRHVRGGDIAVLRTGWSDESWGEDRFWRDGPWLKPDAADWLVERGVKAIVYDFSEEYVVHLGHHFRGEDCIVHHKILGAGDLQYRVRSPPRFDRAATLRDRCVAVEACRARRSAGARAGRRGTRSAGGVFGPVNSHPNISFPPSIASTPPPSAA